MEVSSSCLVPEIRSCAPSWTWVGHIIIYLKYFYLVSKILFAPHPSNPLARPSVWIYPLLFNFTASIQIKPFSLTTPRATRISTVIPLLSPYKPFSPNCQRGLLKYKSDYISTLLKTQGFLILSSIKSKLFTTAYVDLNVVLTCLYNLIPFLSYVHSTFCSSHVPSSLLPQGLFMAGPSLWNLCPPETPWLRSSAQM